MSWGRLSRLLKPALLCGALAVPGLAGTMVGYWDLGDRGRGQGWSRVTVSRVEVGGSWDRLARVGGTQVGKRSLIGIPGAEQGQASAGEIPGGWEPVSGSL